MSDSQKSPLDRFVERPCFTPLTTKVGMAAAKAAGIDPGKVVDVNFEFGPPGHAYVVARYPLDDAAMARVLEALAALPAGVRVARSQIAVLREGEAIWPTAWADLSERSGKTPEASPGRTASGPGAA